MSIELSIQAIVLPRAYYPKERLLSFCVVFGLRPLKLSEQKQGVVPEVFDKWPAWIDAALKHAAMVFEDEKPALTLKFERRVPHDLVQSRWTQSDAETAWAAMFGDLAREEAKARAASPLLSLYETKQAPRAMVNPVAASDLNPAHRFESLTPSKVATGIAAAHFDRIRTEEVAARPELDDKYVKALDPGVVDRALLALAQKVDDWPERYSAEVQASCRRLLGFVGQGGPPPRVAFAAWPRERRTAINTELVNLVLDEQMVASQPEFQRVDRLFGSNKSGDNYDGPEEEKKLREPTYAEMIARVRQYPGLARRLALVVHGVATLTTGTELKKSGRVRLQLEEAKQKLFTKPPVATLYQLEGALFRPKIHNPGTFAPRGADLFYRHHVLDGDLYDVTQQDYLISVARSAARVNEATVVEDRTPGAPSPSSRDALKDEVRRNRTNSIQFVNRPGGRTQDLGTAAAIDVRLRDAQGKLEAHSALTAEDLMAGVAIYVRPRGASADYGWRSLCRRVVRVTMKDGQRPLFAFEEEGYVATSTSEFPAPITGQLKDFELGEMGVTWVKIQRLLVNNTIAAAIERHEASPEERVRFRGSFQRVPNESHLRIDDIVRLTRGLRENEKNWLTEIQIVPILKPGDIALYEEDAILTCSGATPGRKDDNYAVLFSKTTRFLTEMGTPLNRADLLQASQYDPALIRKHLDQFFVEGETRLLANGPFYPPSGMKRVLFRVLDDQSTFVVPRDKSLLSLLIHPSIPPGVLREYHLEPNVDQGRDVPLPLPAATTDEKNHTLEEPDLIYVRELTTPLSHIRGDVIGTEFEMMAYFLKPIEGMPKKAFINLRGQAWQIEMADTGTFPRLFPDQENTVAVNIDETAAQLGGGLAISPWPTPGHVATAVALSVADYPSLTKAKQYLMSAPKGGVVIEAPPEITQELLNPGETPNQLQVQLVGDVTTHVVAGKRVVKLRVRSATRIDVLPAKKGEETFLFSWVLHVKDGQSLVKVRYAAPRRNLGYYREDLTERPELIHPVDAAGFRVGIVTSDGVGGIVTGRAWPQAIPGTTRRMPGQEKRFEFATLDGLRETELVSLDQKEDTGFLLIRKRDSEETPNNFRLASQLGDKDLGALVAAVGGSQQSNLVWVAKGNEPVPIAGEILGIGKAGAARPDVNVLSVALGGNKTAGIALDDQLRTKEFLPRRSNSTPRGLADLQRGEFVVIQGTVDFGTTEFVPGRIRPAAVDAGAKRANLTAVVRGRFIPQPVGAEELLRDGSLKHRVIIRSAGGAEVMIYADEKLLPPEVKQREVVTVASPLLVATTVSRWKKPEPEGRETKATGLTPPRDPVHAVSSDLITRWGGWSLTTQMPGNPDEVDDPTGKPKTPFHIACDRSLDGVHLFPNAGDWRMTPLRFGTEYEFCLHRVDLAGNHLYDEGVLPMSLDAAAFRRIGSLLDENPALAVLGFAPKHEVPRPFERADLPFPAPLVFPANRPDAVWKPESPLVATRSGLVKLTHHRESVLVLFSDCLERVAPLAVSATGTLLPPSAPVETVLMHGVLDRVEGPHIPTIIRCHERYLLDQHLGIDRDGCLNYFGDPQVGRLRVQFASTDALAPPGTMPSPGNSFEVKLFDPWPRPCPVDLSIAARTRKREFLRIVDLGTRCEVRRGQTGAEVHMPPGGVGFAAIIPLVEARPDDGNRQQARGTPFDIGQRIRVIHATNGAWVRPRWVELREVTPTLAQTSRHLQGAFQADIPTSGTFTLSACWNECWDEAVSQGWEEATVGSIRVEKGTGDSAKGEDGTIREVTIQEGRGGYGYGTEAVVLVMVKPGEKSPRKPPLLAPILVEGQVKGVKVIDGGEGFNPTIHELRIIRRPPLFRVAEARVTRTGAGPLREEEIQITDAGGWYTRPPVVVAIDVGGNGYGAKLTARLNDQGGVCRVCVDHGGHEWSDDVLLKFYTHQWSLPERPIRTESPIRVELEPPTTTGEASPPIWQPFSDPAGRAVDYFLTVNPRYAEYLLPAPDEAEPIPADGAIVARTPVPRVSLPFHLNIAATVRPTAPRVARLLPAFRWAITDGNGSPVDSADYFHGREKGQLTLSRKTPVRVYLRRPWHQTGSELLGVVLVPAIASTTRLGGNLNPMDKTVVNRAPGYPNPAGLANALDGDVVPYSLRGIATRWGFDPIHPEGPLPPLDLHHFPAALPGTDTEWLPLDATNPERRAGLALHDVHYDGAKNLWYSDIAINLADRGTPLSVYPFLRLCLVAYQRHAIEEARSSSISVCDPFPVVPDRSLIVKRLGWSDFELTLNGVFAVDPQNPNQFPRRRVVIEVQQREVDLPPEVELFLSPGETIAQRKPLLGESELTWHTPSNSYRGRLKLPDDPRSEVRRVVIAVLEKEYYPTVSPQASATGDRTEMFNHVACGVRTLSSFTIGL